MVNILTLRESENDALFNIIFKIFHIQFNLGVKTIGKAWYKSMYLTTKVKIKIDVIDMVIWDKQWTVVLY